MKKAQTPEIIKQAFDDNVKKNKQRDYETRRWLSNQKNKIDFNMMVKLISFHIKDINFNKCLELGPGPGTWTKLLVKENPNAEFLLLDLSEEMLRQAKNNFKTNKKIKYCQQDFLKFNPREKYDFFFSSRVIEYIPDKEKAVKIIYNLLNENGKAMIITKQPHPLKLKIRKILKKKINPIDYDRISFSSLKKILEKNNFKNIEVYPAIVPWFNSSFLQKIRMPIFNFFYKKRVNFFSKNLLESYLIRFEK